MLIDSDKLKENIKNQLKGFTLNSLDVRKSVKDCIKLIVKTINEQPSEFEWKNAEDEIPAPSEFDPDYSDDVLVIDEDGFYKVASYWYEHSEGFEDDCGHHVKVVAWSHFPEFKFETEEELNVEYEDEFKYSIDRAVFECIWNRYFGDGIGRDENYNNDIFECHIYSWDEDFWNNKYHFWHKPTGYKLRWYKYPLRGADANMDLTPRQFLEILVDCANSIYKDQGIKMEDKTVGKWWEERQNG